MAYCILRNQTKQNETDFWGLQVIYKLLWHYFIQGCKGLERLSTESFGNFEGVGFSEILGIFNSDLFSTFFETVCTKISSIEFTVHYIQTVLFLTIFWQFVSLLVNRKNHKALLWNRIRPNLISFYKTKYMFFHNVFRISRETPDWKNIFF